MHLKDQATFDAKCSRLREDGPGRLHVVSDFDKTLTKAFHNGKQHMSSFGLIREYGGLGEDYRRKSKALFDTYYPIENDPNIPHEQKYARMQEWWRKHYRVMCEEGVSRGILQSVARENPKMFREGIERFFSLLGQDGIPLLIFSAGIGDIILEILRARAFDTDNVHVISNFFRFDEDGKAMDVKSELIHVLNKGEIALTGPYKDAVSNRPNVILLGDSEGDVTMADGLEHATVLRIGFLNSGEKERLPRFEELYDAVITGDGDLTGVNDLLHSIITGE